MVAPCFPGIKLDTSTSGIAPGVNSRPILPFSTWKENSFRHWNPWLPTTSLSTGKWHLHLCLDCPFAQEVWSTVAAWENFGNLQQALQTQADTLIEWWESTLTSVQKERRREFNGMAIRIMWNLWKERNRRIFYNNYSTALQVAGRAKDDLVQYRRAFTTPSH